jgi:hypothetical protein
VSGELCGAGQGGFRRSSSRPARRGHQVRVVDPATGSQSSTWRVFTGKKKDDVYLLEVISGRTWKTSHHHDDGVWRVAMTSEASGEPGMPRAVIDQWPRVPPRKGWSEGVAVLVPCTYLRPSGTSVGRLVVRVPTSPEHSAVAVRLLFAEPGTVSVAELPGAFPVGVLSRPNGGSVYLVAVGVPPSGGF